MKKLALSVALLSVLLVGCNSEDSSTGPVVNPDENTSTNARGHFAGSEACAECHQEQYDKWQDTRHGTFIRKLYTEENHQIGAPWGTEAEPLKIETKDRFNIELSMKGDKYWLAMVDKQDPQKRKEYQIDAVGYRTQLIFMSYDEQKNNLTWFPFAYRTDDKRWYSFSERFWFNNDGTLLPEQNVQLFNAMVNYQNRCADCHLTGFEIKSWKYLPDGKTRVVDDSNIWESEMQTGCEKCHGPAYVHSITQNPADVVNPEDLSGDNRQSECDQCHNAGLPEGGAAVNELPYIFNQDDPLAPGQHFNVGDHLPDFYLPANDRAYYEGLDDKHYKESKTYGMQLAQGKHASLTCSDCHDPHSQTLRIEGDGLCLSCHVDNHENDPHKSINLAEGQQKPGCADCHMTMNGHSLNRSKRYELRAHSFKTVSPTLTLQAFDNLRPYTEGFVGETPEQQEMAKKWAYIAAQNGACYENFQYPENMEQCTTFDLIPNACSSCHLDEFPTPGVFTDEERQKLQQGQARYQRFVDAQQ